MIVHMVDEALARRWMLLEGHPVWMSWCYPGKVLRTRKQRTSKRANVTCPACKELIALKLPL